MSPEKAETVEKVAIEEAIKRERVFERIVKKTKSLLTGF